MVEQLRRLAVDCQPRRHMGPIAQCRREHHDPVVRGQLAATYIRGQLIRYLGLRVQTAISQGRPPGPGMPSPFS